MDNIRQRIAGNGCIDIYIYNLTSQNRHLGYPPPKKKKKKKRVRTRLIQYECYVWQYQMHVSIAYSVRCNIFLYKQLLDLDLDGLRHWT